MMVFSDHESVIQYNDLFMAKIPLKYLKGLTLNSGVLNPKIFTRSFLLKNLTHACVFKCNFSCSETGLAVLAVVC